MYYIKQCRKDDCGFTSLKMLLANVQRDKNYLYLKEEKEKGNYSFKELKEIGALYGLSLVGYRIKDIKDISKISKLPFLLTIKVGQFHHLVMAKKLSHRLYQVYDPKLGRFIYTEAKLNKLMTGTLLVVEQFKKVEAVKPNIFKLRKRDIFLLNGLRLTTLALIILSALFMQEKFAPFIPIILLLSGLIFELMYRIVCLKYFKGLDKMLLANIKIDKNKYYTYYKKSQNYKSLLINNATSYLFSFALFGFLFYLLFVNDMLNLIPFAFTFIFVIFETLYLKIKFKKDNDEIERKEETLLYVDSDEKYKKVNDEITSKAIKSSGLFSIVKLIYYFILLALLIINMSLKNTFTLSYVLFYFFFFGFIKKIMNDIIEHPSKKEEEDVIRCNLISCIENHNDFENE